MADVFCPIYQRFWQKMQEIFRTCSIAKFQPFKPPVPSMIIGNVNPLLNKIDKLAARTKNVKTFKECSLLCLTETWLTADIPDANVELLDISVVRADRDTRACGKCKGKGLAPYFLEPCMPPCFPNL